MIVFAACLTAAIVLPSMANASTVNNLRSAMSLHRLVGSLMAAEDLT